MLEVYKINKDSITPSKGTKSSSCYDLSAYIKHGDTVKFYVNGGEQLRGVTDEDTIMLRPNERCLIPTGIILNIPVGHDVKVYPRSGLSIKSGMSLSNCIGVIDEDYKDELYVSIINNSNENRVITNGDRIAQFELCEKIKYTLKETKKKPTKTTRGGGIGSTGVSIKKDENEVIVKND